MHATDPADEVLRLTGEPVSLRTLLRGAWDHRSLLPLLARQHFLARFRAARLGLAWNVLQPLARGAVLAVVFTRFVPIDTGEIAYAPFVFAGTAIWAFLSESLTAGTTSIAASSDLAGRVYFPRLLLPAMPVAAALPSLVIALGVVIVLAVVSGEPVTWRLLVLPGSVALGFLVVSAAAAVLSLLHVYYRDVGPLVGTAVGILFYATPIIYPLTVADGHGVRWVLEANPLTGVVATTRWALFDGREVLGASVWWTLGWTALLGIAAVAGFRRHERVCADRL